jgi:hypothetical protein
VAERQPLLCVVDDAQWLDRASALVLGFVARRLLAEPVALVFAADEPGEEFRGLPELLVGGLREGAARELLGSVISGPLDEQVRDRIVAETRGNPLALLELPRGVLDGAKISSSRGGSIQMSLGGLIQEMPGSSPCPGAPPASNHVGRQACRRSGEFSHAWQRMPAYSTAETW